MGSIERLILQSSARGMDVLCTCLSDTFCTDTAKAVLAWNRGRVLVTTGFYVAGHAETDGPPGTLFVCRALEHNGFEPIVIADEICRGYFEEFGIKVRYVPNNAGDREFEAILTEFAPVGLIAIERCGKNIKGDYANMRGMSISQYTAPIDRLFELAKCPTVGIGDGGNEIGMGNLADVITTRLSLVPCRIRVDHLIVATVSNWGALGLSAAMGYLPEDDEYRSAYDICVKLGYVDGVTKEVTASDDGFPYETGHRLLEQMRKI